MIRKLKNAMRRRTLAKAGVSVEIDCGKEAYGSGSGSWIVNPEVIDSDSVVYSFGVGRNLSFDLDLIRRRGVTVHAFDPTPASKQWVREQKLPSALKFHDYGIADIDGEIEFYAPRRATSAHFTPVRRYRAEQGKPIQASVKSLRTIMNELGHDRIDVLKMDIEGGEYDVIENILQHAPPIRQLLVEFHHMYETIPISKTISTIARLRSIGFKIFAISDRSYEISLINMQR